MRVNTYPSQTIQKNLRGRNTAELIHEAKTVLIQKPNKDTTIGKQKTKNNYRSISLINR